MQPPAPALTQTPRATEPAGLEVAVDVQGVAKRFGTVEALAGVDLTVRPGEFFSLLGPSGCGKTTLLRCIAGLEHPEAGTIRIHGQDYTAVPAHRRPVNTVFQSYALFPHLDVQENVAFGLRMKRRPRTEIAERVQRALELVQISDLTRRRPAELSGGQKQRVALARALVNEPKVLLLDEPLGALDLQLRRHLQAELHALQRRLGITFIHVTHDQEEALAMSDRIAVMRAGRIEQLDDARTLYEEPRSRFVAEFLGNCNVIEVSRLPSTGSLVMLESTVGPLQVKGPVSNAAGGEPRGWVAVIRPERVRVHPADAPPGPNRCLARVLDTTYVGSETHLEAQVGAGKMKVLCLNTGQASAHWRPGQAVQLEFPPEALRLLPA